MRPAFTGCWLLPAGSVARAAAVAADRRSLYRSDGEEIRSLLPGELADRE
jgi:hypothetical protein